MKQNIYLFQGCSSKGQEYNKLDLEEKKNTDLNYQENGKYLFCAVLAGNF